MLGAQLKIELSDVDPAYGEARYLHNGIEKRCCAFELTRGNGVRLYLPRALGAVTVNLEIYHESKNRIAYRIPCVWQDFRDGCDIYFASVEDLRVGLYFYRVEAMTPVGRLYGVRFGDKIRFSPEGDLAHALQLSVSSFASDAPRGEYGGIIYHIFVDRFSRGGKSIARTDAILDADFGEGIPEYPAYPGAPLKNNTFWGGTLWGVIDRLPYLSSLGVSLIYLSPIFESASNHRYDTGEYMHVDEMLGGEVALKELISRAEEYGIGILLDGVFNHTGSDSLYFNREGRYATLGAYQSKESPYFSWYDFQSQPDEYTAWWGIDILPRLRTDLKEVQDYFVGQGGVVRRYAKMGVRGFRLDVADELPDAFIARIKSALCEENPRSVLYGEVWEDASNKIAYGTRRKYYLGKELDGVMNYPVRTGILEYFCRKKTDALRYALCEVTENTPQRILHLQMNLLGTHDTVRTITALANENTEGLDNSALRTKRLDEKSRSRAQRRVMAAYTILATLPGIPAIFYGDEAGLEGYGDPFNRMPFPWGKEDEIIQNHYKKIGQIRREHSVYQQGEFRLLFLDEDVLVFSRENATHSYLTVCNNSDAPLRLSCNCKFEIFTSATGKKTEHTILGGDAAILRIPLGAYLQFDFE